MPSKKSPVTGCDSARILIAEDHLDSQDALRTLLEAARYQVLVASDGRAAVTTALAEIPDLILMDVMMPELDGLEVTRQLRENHSTKRIPIIAVTAMEGGQRLALEAGADDYLPKPINTKVLLHKINGLLDRQRVDGR
jgi:DNA-binding response OmpR family regulator